VVAIICCAHYSVVVPVVSVYALFQCQHEHPFLTHPLSHISLHSINFYHSNILIFLLLLAAVLAGKKRGRPRSNPLPVLTAAHLMSNSNNNNNGSDGGSMVSGDGTGRWFVLQMYVVAMIIVFKCLFLCVFVIKVVFWKYLCDSLVN